MVNSESKYEQSMNDALDQDLSAAELESLQEQLDSSPEVADLWSRLKQVDRLLRSTPMVGPSAEFASRVMSAILTVRLPEFANRRLSIAVVLGLLAVGLVVVPLLSVLVMMLLSLLTDPGVLNSLLQAVVSVVGYGIDLVSDAGRELSQLIDDMPMVPALLSTIIPLAMIWVWLVWYLVGRTSRSASGEASSKLE
jgi:hypothetical protein